ncbi:MAG: hypothetical protein ACE5IL_11375, partial [Myxococcota bacterium]
MRPALLAGGLLTAVVAAGAWLVDLRVDVHVTHPRAEAAAAGPFWTEAAPDAPVSAPARPAFANLVERLSPAVVNLRASREARSEKPATSLEEFLERGPAHRRPEESTGSG